MAVFWELPIAILSQVQVQMFICYAELCGARSDFIYFFSHSLGWKASLKVTYSPLPSCDEQGHPEDIKGIARYKEVFQKYDQLHVMC